MTNEPQTYRLLVTLPDVTGEEADQIIDQIEMHREVPGGRTLLDLHGVRVTHAPQLWTVMIDGPEFDRVELRATERECWRFLIDYAQDEVGDHPAFSVAFPEIIAAWFVDNGYVIDVKQHDYPAVTS